MHSIGDRPDSRFRLGELMLSELIDPLANDS
jgi:hypothetical protein